MIITDTEVGRMMKQFCEEHKTEFTKMDNYQIYNHLCERLNLENIEEYAVARAVISEVFGSTHKFYK